jgi:signal transduction histidine kinase
MYSSSLAVCDDRLFISHKRSKMKTVVSHPRLSNPLSFLKSLRLTEITPANRDRKLSEALATLANRFGACDAFLFECQEKGTLATIASLPDTDRTASEALMESVTAAGNHQLVENAMDAPGFAGDVAFQTFNISWAFCAPLTTGAQVIGILYLDSRNARSWRPVELELLAVAAEGLALAMSNCVLLSRLSSDERVITAGIAALHCSHSLKNLLQLIGGAAEVIDLALKRNEMPRVLRSWAIMQPNLHRLRRLTLDMLYYSKERPLELAACNINAMALAAVESMAMHIGEKNISLRTSLDEAVGTLQLDSGRIHELITNLILNSADAVAENTGIITISTKLDRRSHAVHLSVSNNGPEMTGQQIANAFVPFHSTKQRFGTGLGLAIAKRIADQHGAKITVKSSPQNTAFILSLPIP